MSDFDEKDAMGQYLASLTPSGPFQDQTPVIPGSYPQAVDNSEDLSLDDSRSPSRVPASLPPAAAPTAPPGQPSVKDYIGQRVAEQQQALKEAQGQAKENEGKAAIAEGIGQMTAGLAHSNTFNPATFKSLHDKANRPVEDVLAQQKNKSDAIQQAALENKTQRTAALDDPNSMQSTVARRLAAQALSKYNEDPSIVDGMSAGDLKEFLEKPLDQMEARDSREAITKLKTQENALKRQELGQAKTAADQNKNYKNLRHDLETFRGNQAAQQASLGVLSANKALDIVKGKDPNTLTTQDLTLLSDELAKIATGGVPGEHGVHALMPNNLQTKYAELKNFVLSKPSDAQAGEYIKKNMEYLNAMKETSQKALNSYRNNIAKGYKKLVHPADFSEAMTDYGLNAPQADSAPPKHSYKAGDFVTVKGKNYRVGADGDSLEPQ
jgi:hypothetical protein